MHSIEHWLMKMGIRTYTDTYYTNLVGVSPTKIGQDMPNPVGWIFGISVDTDSVNPTDQTLANITLGQASQLWLYMKDGTDLYMNNVRVDKLIYYQNNLPIGSIPNYSNQRRYFDVSIPKVTDLKQSYYNNPTGIGTTATPVQIPLTIYYIDIKSYNGLLAKGYFFDGVAALPHHPNSPANKKKV